MWGGNIPSGWRKEIGDNYSVGIEYPYNVMRAVIDSGKFTNVNFGNSADNGTIVSGNLATVKEVHKIAQKLIPIANELSQVQKEQIDIQDKIDYDSPSTRTLRKYHQRLSYLYKQEQYLADKLKI